MPKISMIVPVYKAERYLCRCVDSILAQTVTDFELILVDDGSPDRCPEICDMYAQKDQRVRAVHIPNGGVSNARNQGLQIAKGEYVCFVDSDDIVSSVYLEKLYDDTVDISICGVYYANAEGEITSVARKENFELCEVSPQNMKQWYERGSLYSVWCCMFRTSVIRSAQLAFTQKTSRGEDTIFMFEYVSKCKKVRFIEDILYYYVRYGEGTLTTTLNEKNIKSLDYLDTYLGNWFKTHHLVSEKYEDPYYWTKHELLQQFTGVVQSQEISCRQKYKIYRLVWKTSIYKKYRHVWFQKHSRMGKFLFFAPTPLFLLGYQMLQRVLRRNRK